VPLITSANLQAYTDHVAAVWEVLKPAFGSVNDQPPAAGTVRNLASLLLGVPVGSADVDVESDLVAACYQVYQATGVESIVPWLQQALAALGGHCQRRGPTLNAAITSLSSYLNYLNTAPTGAPFAALLAPGFADLYLAVMGASLPAASFFQRGLSPDLNATAYPNGMGQRAVGGAFVAGAAPDLTRYAEVLPLIVVAADFAGGTAAPQVVLAGTDSAGAAQTWTLTLDSNNPTGALATTITPAVLAQARQTVALASAAGVVPGSTLTVNQNKPDQEVVVVEAVAGANVTAVFQKAHGAGATVNARRTYAPPPGTAGVRLRALTGITVNVTGHTAGTVRVDGRQDRGVV
jgi:hypothetical protein